MRSARSGAVIVTVDAPSGLAGAVACSLSVNVFHAASCAGDRPSLSCSAAWRLAIRSADFAPCEPNAPQWEPSAVDAGPVSDAARAALPSPSDATATTRLLRKWFIDHSWWLGKLCFSHGSHRRRPMYPRFVPERPMCTGVYRPRTRLYRFVSTVPGDTLRYTFVSGRWRAPP